jgi:hypothetical protein
VLSWVRNESTSELSSATNSETDSSCAVLGVFCSEIRSRDVEPEEGGVKLVVVIAAIASKQQLVRFRKSQKIPKIKENTENKQLRKIRNYGKYGKQGK